MDYVDNAVKMRARCARLQGPYKDKRHSYDKTHKKIVGKLYSKLAVADRPLQSFRALVVVRLSSLFFECSL